MMDEFERIDETDGELPEEMTEAAAEETSEAAETPETPENAAPAMLEVVNVQFRGRGKAYYFAPGGFAPQPGDAVVVETSKGLELGSVTEGVHAVPESAVVPPLRPVVRMATKEDIHVGELNRAREKNAFGICEDKIRAHKLDMKLVDVEYSFEGGKILFFFTSDGRVDFRELVKDLAGVFHTRIELRQIGVRDGAKMLGGLGICGRPFCCSTFLEEFQPVSIRMAKTQNLSLNPSKISGTCGRLMCCLKYEQDAYEHLIKTMPKVDAPVDTPKGKGSVAEVNLLRRTVKVKLEDQTETALQSYHIDRLGYTLNGEYIEPKPEEVRQPEPAIPDLSRYMSDKSGTEEPAEDRKGRNDRRRNNRNQKNRQKQTESFEEWEEREPRGAKEFRGTKEPKEKPARSFEPKEKAPRTEGERKKGDYKPRNGKPKYRAADADEGQQGRQPKENRPPKEFHEKHDRKENRPPKDARPPREPRPPRAEQQSDYTAAPKTEKKQGGYYKKKPYYHRDKKKPGGDDRAE